MFLWLFVVVECCCFFGSVKFSLDSSSCKKSSDEVYPSVSM